MTLHHHSLNASPSVSSLQCQHGHLSWELLINSHWKTLNESFWSKCASWAPASENTNSRCSSSITPPPSPRALTHFKQLSTQPYLCCFDEPPDHIFNFDNLLPAGCSTQTIRRQLEEIHYKPHKTRNRKQYPLWAIASYTATRLQQVCLLLISILLVTGSPREERVHKYFSTWEARWEEMRWEALATDHSWQFFFFFLVYLKGCVCAYTAEPG